MNAVRVPARNPFLSAPVDLAEHPAVTSARHRLAVAAMLPAVVHTVEWTTRNSHYVAQWLVGGHTAEVVCLRGTLAGERFTVQAECIRDLVWVHHDEHSYPVSMEAWKAGSDRVSRFTCTEVTWTNRHHDAGLHRPGMEPADRITPAGSFCRA